MFCNVINLCIGKKKEKNIRKEAGLASKVGFLQPLPAPHPPGYCSVLRPPHPSSSEIQPPCWEGREEGSWGSAVMAGERAALAARGPQLLAEPSRSTRGRLGPGWDAPGLHTAQRRWDQACQLTADVHGPRCVLSAARGATGPVTLEVEGPGTSCPRS